MELVIRNTELSASLVPTDPSDAEALEAFALSFDGYAHWGDRCGQVAESAARAFHADGTVPADLSDLRACLFYEQQRWHWQDQVPDEGSIAYLQALLDAIRAAAPDRT